MLALQYGDIFLTLADSEAVVTRWVSTAFNESDELLGSGSVASFDLADTPGNNAALNFANQLGNRLSRKDIEVVVWLMGMPWKRCTFSFNLKDGKISGFTKIDNGEIAAWIKEKTLPQVFIETKNGSFVDFKYISLGNTPLQVSESVANSTTPGSQAYTFFPYNNQTLFGSYSGDPEGQFYIQPDIINRWKDGEIMWRVEDVSVEEQGSFWYTPFLYLTWVIKEVCAHLGYEARGNFFDSDFHQSLIIDNSAVYSFADMWLNPTGFKFAPAKHLPNIKISDFIKQLREQFRIIPYFDSDTRIAYFTLGVTVLDSDERIELDGMIEKSKVSATKIEETGYELIQGIDSGDELFEMNPYVKSFFIGGDRVQKKLELPVSTCFMKAETNADQLGSAQWRVPAKRQLGNAYGETWAVGSQAHNEEGYTRNEFTFRLLSYRGLFQDSLGNFYPYATSDGLAPDGVTEICQSLWLGGSTGILEYYHRRWLIFKLRTELVVLKTYITNILLSMLSPLKKVRFATPEGTHIEALLDEVKFSPTNNRLLRADLRIYPNYNSSAAEPLNLFDFVSGEVANDTPVYVKIEEANLVKSYRRPLFILKVLLRISADIVVSFYSDEAGTVPVNVNGLVLNVIHETMNNGTMSSVTKQYTCYGDSYTILEGVEIFYQNGSTHRTAKMVLAEGPGYIRL